MTKRRLGMAFPASLGSWSSGSCLVFVGNNYLRTWMMTWTGIWHVEEQRRRTSAQNPFQGVTVGGGKGLGSWEAGKPRVCSGVIGGLKASSGR